MAWCVKPRPHWRLVVENGERRCRQCGRGWRRLANRWRIDAWLQSSHNNYSILPSYAKNDDDTLQQLSYKILPESLDACLHTHFLKLSQRATIQYNYRWVSWTFHCRCQSDGCYFRQFKEVNCHWHHDQNCTASCIVVVYSFTLYNIALQQICELYSLTQ